MFISSMFAIEQAPPSLGLESRVTCVKFKNVIIWYVFFDSLPIFGFFMYIQYTYLEIVFVFA